MVLTAFATRTLPEGKAVWDLTHRALTAESTWTACTNTVDWDATEEIAHFRIVTHAFENAVGITETMIWNLRIKDNAQIIWVSGQHKYTGTGVSGTNGPDVIDGFFYKVTTGHHIFYLEWCYQNGGNPNFQLHEDEFKIGELDLKNTTADTTFFTSVSCPDATTTTLINAKSITVPASANLIVGSIKQYNAVCILCVFPDDFPNKFIDAGNKPEDSALSISVEFNSIADDWSTKNSDTYFYTPYICGGNAIASFPADPSQSLNVTVKAYNDTGATRTLSGFMIILVSPWIVTNSNLSPWQMPTDLPMGTTISFTVDPEAFDESSTLYAGAHERIVQFTAGGTATDYTGISTEDSGVGYLSYSFDKTYPNDIDVMARSKLGVIDQIAIDLP